MSDGHRHTKTIGVDVLRGVAILLVVLYHAFGQTYGFYLPWAGMTRNFEDPPDPLLVWLYPVTFGWAGVSLFFVLSGFCIHYSYLRSTQFEISSFFWRRFWRIYPAYIAALIGFTVLAFIVSPSAPLAKQFIWHALLIHNFTENTFFGINASFWSIATEVQLYLIFPILIFLRSRYGIERALLITLLVGCVWRVLAVATFGLPEHIISALYTAPPVTWFDWALGALVAERFNHGRYTFYRHEIWLFILIPCFIGSTLYLPLSIFSFSLAAGISAVCLDAALWRNWRKTSIVTILVFMGTTSYSLYLWHQPIMQKIPHSAARVLGLPAAWAAFVICIVLGAYWSHRLLEQGGIKIGAFLWRSLVKRNKKATEGIAPKTEKQ